MSVGIFKYNKFSQQGITFTADNGDHLLLPQCHPKATPAGVYGHLDIDIGLGIGKLECACVILHLVRLVLRKEGRYGLQEGRKDKFREGRILRKGGG